MHNTNKPFQASVENSAVDTVLKISNQLFPKKDLKIKKFEKILLTINFEWYFYGSLPKSYQSAK